MKISQFCIDSWRFQFDTGMVFIVRKDVLFRNNMLNPDLIVEDKEFTELMEKIYYCVLRNLDRTREIQEDCFTDFGMSRTFVAI